MLCAPNFLVNFIFFKPVEGFQEFSWQVHRAEFDARRVVNLEEQQVQELVGKVLYLLVESSFEIMLLEKGIKPTHQFLALCTRGPLPLQELLNQPLEA
jgi:hypothetical protein